MFKVSHVDPRATPGVCLAKLVGGPVWKTFSSISSRQNGLQPELIEDVKDAYLAAVAEHLAWVHGLALPSWVDGHGRPLKRAFFAGGLQSLKAILTVESPAAFRRRLLFVGKNALDRPRRRTSGNAPAGFARRP